jgi:membrane-bound lytic murein transglycosylase D
MYPTGKMFGLKVDSYIDERCNPYKATVAAAEYLKSLYSMFNDWQMVLAAYNAGPGTISKAIRRSGGKKTYWEIRPYLPLETQGYVPAFIAANYAMNYADDHNIYAALPRKTYFEVDTVVVKEQMSFDQISQALDISNEEILYFNPQYRKNIIPSGGNALCLPKKKIAYFLNNEIDIYAAIHAQKKESIVVEPIVQSKINHVLKYGEKLSDLARRYGVRIQDIKSWNYIGKRGLKPGKRLVIYVREQNNVTPKLEVTKSNNVDTSVKLQAKKNTSKIYYYHKVKKGETLSRIAKKYNVKTSNLMILNRMKSNGLGSRKFLKIKQINK